MIQNSKTGICRTRFNEGGSLKTVVYGNISTISNNPIEKKPFFHFAPGTKALTVGSLGCNASCPFCHNAHISKQRPTPRLSRYVSPLDYVEMAIARGSKGTSISFSEAATLMLEWNIEVFILARDRGLYNTIVTNGYMTPEALDLMIDAGLDAANVDIKGCEPNVREVCGLSLQPVLENVQHMKKAGVHVELTTLVVPELSDDMECLESLAKWILDKIGSKTPWHLNRYYPFYKYAEPPTSVELLLKARRMAIERGLEFVYIGNVDELGLEDTVCPSCGTLCYERQQFASRNVGTDASGRCIECGYNLEIRLLEMTG